MNTFQSLRYCLLIGGFFIFWTGCGGCDEVGGGEFGDDVGIVEDAGQDTGPDDEGDAGILEGECTEEEEGTYRQCGTDVGECRFGAQGCYDGEWGPCQGGVQPRPEQCDGLDNSCSGAVDDGEHEDMCQVASRCTETATCVEGACVVEEIENGCAYLDEPCYLGVCTDDKEGECEQQMVEDGTACDDGDFCTVAGSCSDGVCETVPRDCSALDDQCNVGVCDSEAQACVTEPAHLGESCEDDLFCTTNTTCTEEGTCEGEPLDCSAAGDQCNEGVCNEEAQSCEAEPFNIGESCDDELACTINTTCTIAGTCEGEPLDCSAAGGQECIDGVCDEEAGGCVGEPINIGESCNADLFCVVGSTCDKNGSCQGSPRDCSGLDDQCNVGICDEAAEACVAAPTNLGDPCEDDLFCTVNTTCSASGTCEGQPRDCSAAGDQCNQGFCDEGSQSCTSEPANLGDPCDDGLFCTVSTTCTADGSCEGQPRTCDHLDELCRVGYCDETVNSCELTNVADQTECDTGIYCSVNESCEDGQCVGDPRDCSALDDECNDGVCDEASGECIAIFLCDPCEEGTPTADAGPDQDVLPNTLVTLDGSGSSDPNDQNLSYDWRIESRPDGSSSNLSSTTAESPTIQADVAGEYEICLTVTNPDECTSEESCMTLTITPGDGLHIELTWDHPDPIDLDLHYRAPSGSWFSGWIMTGPPGQQGCTGGDADSVWFCITNPDWGGGDGGEPDGDPENDPYLDIDDLTGDAPENINQDVLFDGDGFRVGVHHFDDYGNGSAAGRIRIYFNGGLVFEETRTTGCGDFWEVADIDVSGGGTVVDVTSLNGNILESRCRGVGFP